jgi:hypothetical protein
VMKDFANIKEEVSTVEEDAEWVKQ